jgi:hypothetical protein
MYSAAGLIWTGIIISGTLPDIECWEDAGVTTVCKFIFFATV